MADGRGGGRLLITMNISVLKSSRNDITRRTPRKLRSVTERQHENDKSAGELIGEDAMTQSICECVPYTIPGRLGKKILGFRQGRDVENRTRFDEIRL